MDLRGLKPVYIGPETTVTAPENQYFKAITVLAVNGTISVKGGIYQGLDADDSDGSTHLAADGSTLDGTHAAGIYELIPTVALAMTIPAGTTVRGNFSEIACGPTDTVMAYL
jgi:hypothetical protein